MQVMVALVVCEVGPWKAPRGHECAYYIVRSGRQGRNTSFAAIIRILLAKAHSETSLHEQKKRERSRFVQIQNTLIARCMYALFAPMPISSSGTLLRQCCDFQKITYSLGIKKRRQDAVTGSYM